MCVKKIKEKISQWFQNIYKVLQRIRQSDKFHILLMIIVICAAIKFFPDKLAAFLNIKEESESAGGKGDIMSFIELIIEGIFVILVWKEFKMTKEEFKMTRKEFEITRKEFEMTRKQFELQEEELKNKYCHEVWHSVGMIFFHKLFNDFSIDKGVGKYVDMIKQHYNELDKEIEEKIKSLFEEKIPITNPAGENVADNYKEVFEKYKEIVLTIATQLSKQLYKLLKNIQLDISEIKPEKIQSEEFQMMAQLSRYSFIALISIHYFREEWGDKTISSLYKLLMNTSVPKGNKKL